MPYVDSLAMQMLFFDHLFSYLTVNKTIKARQIPMRIARIGKPILRNIAKRLSLTEMFSNFKKDFLSCMFYLLSLRFASVGIV